MVTVFIASLFTQVMNSVSLILQGLSVAFPEASIVMIQMLMAVVSVASVVGMLLAGKLVSVVNKKMVLVGTMALLAASGLVGYLLTFDLTMVYVAGALSGIAGGALIPVAQGAIAEYFDGNKRATFMGLNGVFVNGGGVLANLVGGILASIFWKDLFFVHIAAVIVALVALFLMPVGGVEKVEQGDKAKVFTRYLAIMMLQGVFIGIAMMTMPSNLTFYVFELGIGNEVQSGLIQMAFAGGSVVIGIIIAPTMMFLRRYTFSVALILGAAGLWLFAQAGDTTVFIIAAVLIGLGFTVHNTSFYTLTPMNAHPAATTMTMSLYTVAMTVGMLFCSLLLTPIASAFGDTVSMRFVVAAVMVSVVAVFGLFDAKILKDYKLTLK